MMGDLGGGEAVIFIGGVWSICLAAARSELCGFFSFSKLAEHCRNGPNYVSTPLVERILTLPKKFVPLIDRSNARNCTRLVIEYFIGNVRSNS
jgi:hypothetical protein